MLRQFLLPNILEAGCDEAGRGCLAGPVSCAAVILHDCASDGERFNDGEFAYLIGQINDSKKISEITREKLRPIIENSAIAYAVAHISPSVIDEINILQASILGMQQSVLKLDPQPKHLIVDGNRFNSGLFLPKKYQNRFVECADYDFTNKSNLFLKENQIGYTTIIKGDEKYQSIAAASILAKTYRDEYMKKIDKEFPMYNWKQNKGYPTKEHKEAIAKYGLTKYHRKTFKSNF